MQKQVEVNRAEGNLLLCVATFLPVRRWRDVISFLSMSSRVEKQLKVTKGLIRYSVRADIIRKHFWTFTVWSSKAEMNSFVTSEPHATSVRKFGDWAGAGAAFVEWISATGSIDWSEALDRLKNPTFYYGQRNK